MSQISRFTDNLTKRQVAYAAWAVAVASMLGSLLFSEVFHFVPCVLCWYQRALMFPLVFIIAVGIIRKDSGLHFYVLPLSVLGLVLAAYHSLLQWGIIPEEVAPCVAGISCLTKYIDWFGFITIPFLSFVSFGIVSICMILFTKAHRYE